MSEHVGRSVVVGADGGGTDGSALRWAARHAGRTGLDLLVVHASEPEALAARAAGAGAPDITALLEAEDARAETVRSSVSRLALEMGVRATTVVERGSPVRALLRHQDEAALLVVGTGRKGALEEFVLGTTSIGVTAHATVPVVVLNPEVDVDALTSGRIAVAVDGSPDSRAAARAAVAHAAVTGATVAAVTAWYLEVVDGYVVTEPESPEWQQIEQERRALVEDVLRQPRQEHPDVPVDLVVRRGPIVSTLTHAARGLDLIVLGSKGRGSFAGRLLGSVSQRVMRGAQCPVMVVTSPRR